MNLYTAGGALLVVTVITSFCADYRESKSTGAPPTRADIALCIPVVGAIDEFANEFSIPKAFIGLILLPIVGNAAGPSPSLLTLGEHSLLTLAPLQSTLPRSGWP